MLRLARAPGESLFATEVRSCLFQELDEATLHRRTMEMNEFLLSREGLEFLTVSHYAERLDA